MTNPVHHVGILVDNIEEATEFFRRLLGLEMHPGIDSERMTTRFAAAGPISLEFIELHDAGERARRLGSDAARIEHVAFEVGDLERRASELRDLGVRMSEAHPRLSAGWRSYWTLPHTTGGVVLQFLEPTSPATAGTAAPLVARARERQVTTRAGGVRTRVLLGAPGSEGRVTTGTTEIPPGGAVAPHIHNCDESVLVVLGRGLLECGDERVAMAEGDAVLVPLGTTHRFLNQGQAPLQIYWTYFAGEPTRTLVESGQTYRIGSVEEA